MRSITSFSVTDWAVSCSMSYRAVLLALALQAVSAVPVEDRPFDFSQHKLIRIRPQETQDLHRLEELRQKYDVRMV